MGYTFERPGGVLGIWGLHFSGVSAAWWMSSGMSVSMLLPWGLLGPVAWFYS